MAKADSVYITPPINASAIEHPMMFPPRDPTRRRFLTEAAVASVVSASTLAAATMAPPANRVRFDLCRDRAAPKGRPRAHRGAQHPLRF